MKESDFITNCYTCTKAFNSDECNEIIRLYNSEKINNSFVLENSVPLTNNKLIYQTPQTDWIFQKIGQIAEFINHKYYNFILFKLNEYIQVLKFKENDFFTWKKDIGTGKYSIRKISIMLFLSESNCYEGGTIDWFNNTTYKINNADLTNLQSISLQQEQGNIIIFPSFLPYHLNLLTKGEKYILTTWALGSHFY